MALSFGLAHADLKFGGTSTNISDALYERGEKFTVTAGARAHSSHLRVVAIRRVITAMTKQSNKSRKPGAVSEPEGVRGVPCPGRAEQLPADLHLSNRSSLSDMAPGEIVFLDDFAYLRDSFAPNFVAVLACPLCGSPGLITSVQYSGGAPIVCTSKVCSGLFRIVDETQVVSLLPT